MSAESYFNGIAARQRRYAHYGLSACPSDQEVFELILALSDRIDALYEAACLEPYVDHRGCTRARRIMPEVV